MENYRSIALPTLRSLMNKNLYDTAIEMGTLVLANGKKNKGWVGQTLEAVLGLTDRNLQKMDGIDYELKSTTLVQKGGNWFPKETIKITQLNPRSILNESFETSALWNKFSKLIFVGVSHESEKLCKPVRVSAIDLKNPLLIEEMKSFWEDVQNLVAVGEIKSHLNFGNSEGLLQLRPTGDGRCFSTCPITNDKYPARAFYATKKLLNLLLND